MERQRGKGQRISRINLGGASCFWGNPNDRLGVVMASTGFKIARTAFGRA